MEKQIELGQLAEILSGYTFRGSVPVDTNGDLFVIQASNLSESGLISDLSKIQKIDSSVISANIKLRNNDILITSRRASGGKFRSALVKDASIQKIASSTLIIIRLKTPNILPEYVSVFLNSSKGQQILAKISVGSSVQTLSTKSLSALAIPVPDLKLQKSIIAITKNIQKQQEMSTNRSKLLDIILSSVSIQIIK